MFKRKFKRKARFDRYAATVKRAPRKRPFNRSLFVILFGLIALGVTLYSITSMNLFRISNIVLTPSNNCIGNEDLQKNILQGQQNIFFIDDQHLSEQIKKKYLCVKSVTVQKKLPSTLSINVTPRIPALIVDQLRQKDAPLVHLIFDKKEGTASASISALQIPQLNFDVVASSISGQFVVDTDGVIFDHTTPAQVPIVVSFLENAQLGGSIDPKFVKNIQEILQKLTQMGFTIDSTKIAEDRFLLINSQHPIGSLKDQKLRLVFDVDNDSLRQIASLQLILQKTTMDSKRIESVDVRFEKPVVVYSQQKGRR